MGKKNICQVSSGERKNISFSQGFLRGKGSGQSVSWRGIKGCPSGDTEKG